MKFSVNCIRQLVKEAATGRLIVERPWSVEIEFRLSGGKATDSEGYGPDGFQVVLRDDDGNEAAVVVDTYWNPQAGDTSGNQLYATVDGKRITSNAYVPTKLDDGKPQRLVISNSPKLGAIVVSHCEKGGTPIAYLAFRQIFAKDSSINVSCHGLGDSDKLTWKIVSSTNL